MIAILRDDGVRKLLFCFSLSGLGSLGDGCSVSDVQLCDLQLYLCDMRSISYILYCTRLSEFGTTDSKTGTVFSLFQCD